MSTEIREENTLLYSHYLYHTAYYTIQKINCHIMCLFQSAATGPMVKVGKYYRIIAFVSLVEKCRINILHLLVLISATP